MKENRGKANSLPSNSRKEFLLVLLHWVGTEEKANFSLLVLLNSNVLQTLEKAALLCDAGSRCERVYFSSWQCCIVFAEALRPPLSDTVSVFVAMVQAETEDFPRHRGEVQQ